MAGGFCRLMRQTVLSGLIVAMLLPFVAAVSQETLTDPIADLQQRMNRGEIGLEFRRDHGYLASLLEKLDIPVSSQTLVFSKTSLQSSLISPGTPRALYFNDEVYVGWVQNGPVIEIASVDPKLGTIFYTLEQQETLSPAFKHEGARCVLCHLPARSSIPVPRLMVMSVMANPHGELLGTDVTLTTDESPLTHRWGGWYVTGAHGDAFHRGNQIFGDGRNSEVGEDGSMNLSDLKGRFDASPYLNGHSDIVALTLLVHQSHVHNLIGEAAYAVRTALQQQAAADRQAGRPISPPSAKTTARVAEVTEPVVRALFFSGVQPLSAPIEGTSGFAEEFQARSIRDKRGRSLRDFDLYRRLFRYPLSYLAYSKAFDGMPEPAREYAYRRVWEVLTGRDRTPEFAHLSSADRSATLQILRETKPDFEAWTRRQRGAGLDR
jgi:hypothetical protein